MKYLLGTDNGGSFAKAALFSLDGREIAAAGQKTEMSTPKPGHTERDMPALWQATAASIREVLARSGVRPADVVAVAATGHGNGLYLVDADGCPVRPGIVSTDSRAKDYVARWYADGTHRAVLPHTMQSLWPGQPNALLAWLLDHEPETIRRARWALMCKDYIRFRLTGRIEAELTDQSGTSLMSVRDGGYCDEVLRAFGLQSVAHLMPPIRRPEEICGQVTAQAAEETGLAPGTPVAGGLFDIVACALASGVVDENAFSMVAGTWGICQYVSHTPVVDPDLFMCARYCTPGDYLVPEASPTSASNLEWFVTQFLPEAKAQQSGSIFDRVNQWVASCRPEDADIVFLPFLFGSNAQPDAKASLLGMNGWHSRANVLRAIYEGVAFGHKTHFDRLLRFRRAPRTIRLTGGAARSEVWVQIFADLFQTPVEIPAGTELGALGSAICAAVAVGIYKSCEEAVRAMVQIARTQQPDPSRADLYQRKYRRYRAVVDALGPVWKQWES